MVQITTPPEVPLLVPAGRAARMCSKSVRTWRSWHAGGLIPSPVRIGRSLLWRVSDLKAWTAAGCPTREIFDLERM
jgi:predicted DNA-binding transcriptional regulator AlpA